jgi:TubC N-terminal docking domain
VDAAELLIKLRRLGLAVSLEDADKVAIAPKTLLTSDLRQEIVEHKSEVLTLLHREEEVKRILSETLESLRPYLSPSLAALEDEKLLALVNWSIMVALRRLVDKLESKGKR